MLIFAAAAPLLALVTFFGLSQVSALLGSSYSPECARMRTERAPSVPACASGSVRTGSPASVHFALMSRRNGSAITAAISRIARKRRSIPRILVIVVAPREGWVGDPGVIVYL